jgi:hypothetical protein
MPKMDPPALRLLVAVPVAEVGRGGGGLGLGMGGWAKLTFDLCIASLAVQRLGDCDDCSVIETTRYRI